MKWLMMLLSVGMLLVSGCSSVNVKHDYDKNAEFSSLKVFDWIPQPVDTTITRERRQRRAFFDARLKNAVNENLAEKGFQLNAKNPDFQVVYHLDVKDRINATDWGYNTSGNWTYWGWGGRDVDVQQYRQGTLVIDIVDAATKQLIWRGLAQGALPEKPLTPEEAEKKINKVVGKILDKFPPSAQEE
jgi:hypothetical protein